jgi:hypothetical protein
MIMRRLKMWLARAIGRIVVARPASLPSRTLAPSRALAALGAPRPYRSGLASSQWLADARRLRARPTSRHATSSPSVDHLRQILRDPGWTTAFDAGRLPGPPRSTPQIADSRASQQSTGTASSRPLTSPSPADHSAAELAQHRLVFVRELVRRGIYNEGFDPRHVPPQYRPKSPPPGDPTS